MRNILIILLITVSISGCYYDHADLVYPQATCSLTSVTYSSSVVGILSANCYSCHSGSAVNGGGIKLDSYTSLKTYQSNGQLMNSINHTGGIAVMPLNGSKLSVCEINTIQAWITAGTPNN